MKLMITYAQLGMRVKALRLYEEFQQALTEDIAIHPSQETTHIFERIQQDIH